MNKTLKDFLLGIAAGAAIAFGGILNIVAKTLLNNWSDLAGKIVGSLLFPIGLTLVCFLGFNLFTGKIGYLLDNKPNYLGFLGIVYLGNIVGSLIMGFLCLAIFKNVEPVYNVALTVSAGKQAVFVDFLSGVEVFAKACLCGMLVYLAVYFYKTLKHTALKIVGIFIPIAVFVYFGFDHCVANMFYFSFAFDFAKPLTYLNIAVATLGNSVGAIALNIIKNLVTAKKN